MKRKLGIITAMILGAITLGGCGEKVTAEELLQNNTTLGDNMEAHVTVPMQIEANMYGMSISMEMDMDVNMKTTKDVQYASGTMTMNFAGENQTQDLELYVDVPNNKTYTFEPTTEQWVVTDLSSSGSLFEMVTTPNDLSMFQDITLDSKTSKEEYIVTAKIDPNAMGMFNSDAAGLTEMMGQDVPSMEEAFAGVMMNAEFHYDKSTKQLKSYKCALDKEIVISTGEGEEASEMKMLPFEMAIEIIKIGDIELEIPSEVVDNAVSQDQIMSQNGYQLEESTGETEEDTSSSNEFMCKNLFGEDELTPQVLAYYSTKYFGENGHPTLNSLACMFMSYYTEEEAYNYASMWQYLDESEKMMFAGFCLEGWLDEEKVTALGIDTTEFDTMKANFETYVTDGFPEGIFEGDEINDIIEGGEEPADEETPTDGEQPVDENTEETEEELNDAA